MKKILELDGSLGVFVRGFLLPLVGIFVAFLIMGPLVAQGDAPTKAATTDTPLSEAGALRVQLATTSLERDLLKAQADAETFLNQQRQKAQQTYQAALAAVVKGEGTPDCTLAAGSDTKTPVLRCPVPKESKK